MVTVLSLVQSWGVLQEVAGRNAGEVHARQLSVHLNVVQDGFPLVEYPRYNTSRTDKHNYTQ